MAELKPCPFGCKAGLTVYQSLDCEYVICDRCESTGPAAKTRDAAIAAWNRRATDGQRAAVPEPFASICREELARRKLTSHPLKFAFAKERGMADIGEVRAFLVKYYSEGGQDQDCRDPMHTIPTKDRLGLVTVAGEQYQIADIGMRMLEPHELYAAQGFPSSYEIAPVIDGRRLPKHAQVRMCGNSVSPPMAAALARANTPELASWSVKERKALEASA